MDGQIVDPDPGKNYNIAISAGDPHFEMEKSKIMYITVIQIAVIQPLRLCWESFIRAIEHFFRVYIASSKHSRGWENSRKICKSLPWRRLLFAYLSQILPTLLVFRWGQNVNTDKVLYNLIVAVLFCNGNLLHSRQRKSFFDVVKEERSRTIKV